MLLGGPVLFRVADFAAPRRTPLAEKQRQARTARSGVVSSYEPLSRNAHRKSLPHADADHHDGRDIRGRAGRSRTPA